jgi:hypothetical protein
MHVDVMSGHSASAEHGARHSSVPASHTDGEPQSASAAHLVTAAAVDRARVAITANRHATPEPATSAAAAISIFFFLVGISVCVCFFLRRNKSLFFLAIICSSFS